MRPLLSLTLLALALPGVAAAQTSVPRRQIPPTVLAELAQVQNRFELALAADCDATRCFPKGCGYVDHAAIDRPRRTSLPGLGGDAGPGSVEPQEFLTRATCAFAHEEDVTAEEAQALAKRLGSKVSSGFVVVDVQRQALSALPDHLRHPAPPEPPPEDPADAVPPPPPPDWSERLFSALLPHVSWMLGIVLATLASVVLFWAWRRVGTATLEEQLLLAEMAAGSGADTEVPAEAAPAVDPDAGFVAERARHWADRFTGWDADEPPADLQALGRELLRSGDLPLLAKAALTLPAGFLDAFPVAGELARAKLALADYLKAVRPDELPDEAAFYRALDRHALAARLAAQDDASLVASIRDDFGAAGLAGLVGQLPDRAGALLFALAPAREQREMVRLLPPDALEGLAGQLLASDRMDPFESQVLFRVLDAARTGRALPEVPPLAVTDRGARFDAAGALGHLLPSVDRTRQAALFAAALRRSQGRAPAWYRTLVTPSMLRRLPGDGLADLLLSVDAVPLAAWLDQQTDADRAALLDGMPRALRASLDAVAPSDAAAADALAGRARDALAAGLQRQLAREGMTFEQVLLPAPEAPIA